MSILYITATPVGNLEDITIRALRVLSEVDFVLCEDTRVTKKLLNHFKIKVKTISYHQHSNSKKVNQILGLLEDNKKIALVSDAGTPCISDPGGKLVESVWEKFGDNIKIEAVPGVSVVTTALSISGFSADKFIFLGFPPHKKGRNKFITQIADTKYTKVVYESKYRILKFLKEISELGNFQIVVCRELTKMYESIYRGNAKEVLDLIKNNNDAQKGEFVIVIK